MNGRKSGKRTFESNFEVPGTYAGQKTSSMRIGTCGPNFVWRLAREGRLSVYDLYRNSKGIVEYQLAGCVDDLGSVARDNGKLGESKGSKYLYPSVHKTVRRLEQLGLIRTSKDTSGIRNRRIAELTLLGLLVYLRGSTDKDRLEKALEKNGNLFTFFPVWDMLVEELGEEKVKTTLTNALNQLQCPEVGTFTVDSTCVEVYYRIDRKLGQHSNRNEKVASLLTKKEASVLAGSYFSYLLLHDSRMSQDRKEQGCKPSSEEPFSTTELVYFEKRGLPTRSFFKEGRSSFFQKFCGLESLVTGIFVENLLWT
jgi:hypothetical protein